MVVCGGEQAGVKGGLVAMQHRFYPVKCHPVQQLYRSSALWHSVESYQKRGGNGWRRRFDLESGPAP